MLTRILTRSTVTAVTAAILLACAVNTTSARNLSVSNQNLRATWRSMEFQSEAATIRCALTLEGSFHTRTIAKVTGSLAGAVTRAIMASCTGGAGAMFNGTERYNGTTTPNTLPWHLTYRAFRGRLPAIEALQVSLSRFRFGVSVTVFGVNCTAQIGSETDSISADAAREAGGAITSISPVAGLNIATIIREDNDPFDICPRAGNLVGVSTSITVLSSVTRVTINLI